MTAVCCISSITRPHVEAIVSQSNFMLENRNVIKNKQQAIRRQNVKERRDRIDASLPANLLTHVEQARVKRASLWLNAITVEEQGLTLNKEYFKDSLRIRYHELA